ncbi:MAG: chlororespiratory reduction 6 domain-containing protein [Ignavibacteria bacterium]|nr:chlororespiratory reduction 6 domain-containing protein [Ignavibacteria bacterium]
MEKEKELYDKKTEANREKFRFKYLVKDSVVELYLRIENLDLFKENDFIELIEILNKKHGFTTKNLFNSIVIIFENDVSKDAREVFEIPEIRTWLLELRNKIPHILYFLKFDSEYKQFYYILPILFDKLKLIGRRHIPCILFQQKN